MGRGEGRQLCDPMVDLSYDYYGGPLKNRTYGVHINLYISLFLRATFGPIYLLSPPVTGGREKIAKLMGDEMELDVVGRKRTRNYCPLFNPGGKTCQNTTVDADDYTDYMKTTPGFYGKGRVRSARDDSVYGMVGRSSHSLAS